MNATERQNLIDQAIAVQKHAYAPYSKFNVGAALLADDGQVFVGCNVENASYGMTICAERTAVFSAVAKGLRKFTGIAIATPGGHTPCGACRQVLAEFCADLPVLLVDSEQPNQVLEMNLRTLLPGRFELPP